jgi:hypothetical protein
MANQPDECRTAYRSCVLGLAQRPANRSEKIFWEQLGLRIEIHELQPDRHGKALPWKVNRSDICATSGRRRSLASRAPWHPTTINTQNEPVPHPLDTVYDEGLGPGRTDCAWLRGEMQSHFELKTFIAINILAICKLHRICGRAIISTGVDRKVRHVSKGHSVFPG